MPGRYMSQRAMSKGGEKAYHVRFRNERVKALHDQEEQHGLEGIP